MTPKPKTPTASGISRLLAAAGFEKAIVKLRGGHAGFEVTRGADDGAVYVRHTPWSMRGIPPHLHREWLESYAEAISAAGYATEVATYAGAPDVMHLIVTAKTEA